MKENQISLIAETEKLICEQIMHLETENSVLTEKVLLRESQIKQTSTDLQDAYNRLIKQSQEECNFYLNEILDGPKKEFLQKSQAQLQSKFDHLRSIINDGTKKIKKVEICVEASEKYIAHFEELINSLSTNINANISDINQISIKFANESVQKLKKENNDEARDQYYQKKCLKLKNLENKNSELSDECNQLMSAKKEIKENISLLSDGLISLSQKISNSIQSKELIQLEKHDFDIVSIEPACQKRKMPAGNLLVLAPIHSLTRQMKGSQNGSLFFPKKNIFF